ncbi:MAG: chemotaxis protein CheD [Desulfuromonadaceae bacterium]|nr:chemotaxis protein CheD [Desulfuromonadaceae bacterium]
MSENRLRVGIAQYLIATPPAVLVTYGLGSCLAVVLYDESSGLGGLAHTLLPHALASNDGQRREKFVDEAITMMITELNGRGCATENLTAKLVGGATMFEPSPGSGKEPIGVRNTRAAREVLKKRNIPVIAEDVGGNHGRTLEFDLASGMVIIKSVRGQHHDLAL